MSIRVISLVFNRFPGSGSQLLAMLAMADWADDEGRRLFPSVRALASKTRLSPSQARRVLHSLMAKRPGGPWWIRVIGNEAGGPPGTTRIYEINVERLKQLPDLSTRVRASGNRIRATGSAGGREGSHERAETGRMDATQTVNETSENRQDVLAKERKRVLSRNPGNSRKSKFLSGVQALEMFVEVTDE